MEKATQLKGHTSAETAFVVQDYPYGFRLRCQMRYWVETNPKHGERFVSQTSNPKVPGLVWNKPKAGTYHPAVVMVQLAENGHVKHVVLSPYADMEEVEAFAAAWELNERQQKTVGVFRIARRMRNGMSAAEAVEKAGVPA